MEEKRNYLDDIQSEFERVRKDLKVNQPTDINILKSNQLDAEQLDSEILLRLKLYFSRIFMFFEPSLKDNFQPELSALLSGSVYYFSVFEKEQSFGDALQNLKYRNEWNSTPILNSSVTTFQKFVHFIFTILLPYFWQRINIHTVTNEWGRLEEENWRKRIWRIRNQIEYFYKWITMFNFLVFLYNGKYRSITDRILGMRLVYETPLMSRNISFDYMNRELVWNGFAEMILFIFPLINFEKIKNWLFSWGKKSFIDPKNHYPFNCPICQKNITVPYVTNCGHYYDYFCIHNLMVQEGQVDCLKCGKKVNQIKRLEV